MLLDICQLTDGAFTSDTNEVTFIRIIVKSMQRHDGQSCGTSGSVNQSQVCFSRDVVRGDTAQRVIKLGPAPSDIIF